MPVKSVILDWNGTLIRHPDEGKLWKYVGVELLKDSAYHGRLVRAGSLFKSMLKLLALTKRYKAGEVGYDDIYELYNKEVLSGTEYGKVLGMIDDYAAKPETLEAVDMDLLNIVSMARRENVSKAGILSTGCCYGIREILNKVSTRFDWVDFIYANDFETKDGKIIEFKLDIFGNKDRKLYEAMQRENIDENEAVYVGDTAEDDRCFDAVAFPVLSPNATPEFREEFSRRHPKGLVLEPTEKSYRDFEDFLAKA